MHLKTIRNEMMLFIVDELNYIKRDLREVNTYPVNIYPQN